jgi:hypothetical protein
MLFSKYKFRSHAGGRLMTDPRSKTEKLSETTKSYLLECYIDMVYGRKKEIHSKYITKGLEVEEDSLTLYSRVNKRPFNKNQERMENDFICGTPDIILADRVIDIKSSWSIHTFFDAKSDGINKNYFWQLQCYMALTGKEKATLAYCLVDTPLMLIEDEKRKLAYRMGAITNESPDYLAACEEIEKNMTFQDIPIKERVFEIEVTRDDEAIEKLYNRIELCREYLDGLFPDESDPRESLAAEHAILHTPI